MALRSDLRFTRLVLKNWRNFGLCALDLAPRAFLVGPNASGKSNLLDVFRFLHDVVATGGGLQAALARRGGVSALRALHARRDSEIRIVATIGTDADRALWRYELGFRGTKNEAATITTERVTRGGTLILDRPGAEDLDDPRRLTQTHLEQISTNRGFRELVDFLASTEYLHVVPQLIRDPDRLTSRHGSMFGTDLIERIAETKGRTQQSRLDRITKALQVAVPQIENIDLQQDARGLWHIRAKYQHWRPQGAWQTEESFSDGTLRLLGLLWALQEPGGPLLLEEPELSLHPAVVRRLPALFARAQRGRGRQIIVTTHSEALLADEGIGLDEVFLLRPQQEGTEVVAANEMAEVRALLDGGVSLGEAVLPRVAPARPEQLSLLDL
ncbi:MAG: AAA family ATPase [Proteobacteria bacterium]|nr:AAA family ATPase [Pseudomonadota bacterium]